MSTITPFSAQVPIVDPATGKLTREGLRFVNDLFARVGGTFGLSTTDVDAGSFAAMQPATIDYQFSDITQSGAGTPDQAAEVMQADNTQPLQFWSP